MRNLNEPGLELLSTDAHTHDAIPVALRELRLKRFADNLNSELEFLAELHAALSVVRE